MRTKRTRPIARASEAPFPETVLLVDRPSIVKLLAASEAIARSRIAVVCIDGTPSRLAAALGRGFRAGRRAAILYLHDAATVIYPFAVEPVATLIKHRGSGPIVYRDLGLAPIGASPRRFRDATLPPARPIFHLDAIPAPTLARYCVEAARRLTPAVAPVSAPSQPHHSRDRADRRRARSR